MATVIAAATGRRKTSIARVRLVAGTGKWNINERELACYLPSEALRNYLVQPLVMYCRTRHEKKSQQVGKKGGRAAGAQGGCRGCAGAAQGEDQDTMPVVELKVRGRV